MPQSKGGISGLMDYLQTATKEQLLGKDFSGKLDNLIEEMRQNRQPSGSTGAMAGGIMGLNSLIGLVMGRTDLSDFDADKIVSQIQSLKGKLGEQTDKVAAQVGITEPEPIGRVRTDIEY
jgi:hypothetical protein